MTRLKKIEDYKERIYSFISEIIEKYKHTDCNILIVGHKDSICFNCNILLLKKTTGDVKRKFAKYMGINFIKKEDSSQKLSSFLSLFKIVNVFYYILLYYF